MKKLNFNVTWLEYANGLKKIFYLGFWFVDIMQGPFIIGCHQISNQLMNFDDYIEPTKKWSVENVP